MNYRHSYHAGNFADVFKHVLLSLLLQSLARKDAPFFFLDTHAGAGRYDLLGAAAQKTGEYRDGIQRFWNNPPVAGTEAYLAAVRALNEGEILRYYPGSPHVVRHLLRPQDRAVFLERHPEECAFLSAEFARDRQITVRCQDGYAGLKALLPPRERRGMVLMDPPYESVREFEQVLQGLREARERWETGLYAVWYPVKARGPVEKFHHALVASGTHKVLVAEFSPYPEESDFRLNGCGMVLINPPWKFDETTRALLPKLLNVMSLHPAGSTAVFWLVPE